MKKFIMECNMLCKTVAILLLVGTFLGLQGCAGNVKVTKPDGTEVSTPAAVAVMENAALAIDACEENSMMLSVSDLSKLSASAQAEYMDSLPMILLLQERGGTCAKSVAAATTAYYTSQAQKYGIYKSVGTASIWGLVTYGGITALTGMVDGAIEAAGDSINTGAINITKSDDPIGGEGGGAGDVTGSQTIVIGSGSAAGGERATVMDAEKGINFPGDSNMDADGAPAGQTGVILDDSGDGAGTSLFE